MITVFFLVKNTNVKKTVFYCTFLQTIFVISIESLRFFWQHFKIHHMILQQRARKQRVHLAWTEHCPRFYTIQYQRTCYILTNTTVIIGWRSGKRNWIFTVLYLLFTTLLSSLHHFMQIEWPAGYINHTAGLVLMLVGFVLGNLVVVAVVV